MAHPHPHLYLPHRFSAAAGEGPNGTFTNADSPSPMIHFPLPNPPGMGPGSSTVLPAQLRFKPIYRAPVSTKTAPTKITTSIENMGKNTRRTGFALKRLRQSDRLWNNLKAYACSPSVPGILHQGVLRHTHNMPHTFQLPNSAQQSEAISALWGWFIIHTGRKEMIVASEAAVQDEVNIQLLELINIILRTRYHNTITNRQVWPRGRDRPVNAYAPQWGRPCAAAHRSKNASKAGFPDFILHRSLRRQNHGAICEVKTAWAYSDEAARQILSSWTAARNTGEFNWSERDQIRDGKSILILKQIWGEAHFFKSKWGFWTNGSVIFIFVVTGQDELTLSTVQSLTQQSDIYEALVGLAFASVDAQRPQNEELLLQILCSDKHSRWQGMETIEEHEDEEVAEETVESEGDQEENGEDHEQASITTVGAEEDVDEVEESGRWDDEEENGEVEEGGNDEQEDEDEDTD